MHIRTYKEPVSKGLSEVSGIRLVKDLPLALSP